MAFRRNRASHKVSRRSAKDSHASREPDGDQAHDSGKLSERDQEKVTAAALKMLAARPRTEMQLRERLMRKPWANRELIDVCILRLKEMGYIDDGRFAESYASHRLSARPVGRARLARELALKKVDRKTIDRALDRVFEDTGEDDLIDQAIQKRIRTHGRPADRGDAKRMFDHLARLGFEFDLIIRKLNALRTETINDE